MKTINKILIDHSFILVLLGTDTNLTGNALYIKESIVLPDKKI